MRVIHYLDMIVAYEGKMTGKNSTDEELVSGMIPALDTSTRFSDPNSHDCDRCLSIDGPGMTAFWIIIISLFFVVLTKFIRNRNRNKR
jgi:hypothetical protein